jgi:hypothetical protein
MLVQAHALRRKLLGETHPETARAARELAALHRAWGEVVKTGAAAQPTPARMIQ